MPPRAHAAATSPGASRLSHVALVIDGDLDQRTGGYLYDRIVIDGLTARGLSVEVTSLRAGAFAAIGDSVRVARRLFGDGPDVVVVDELCHSRAVLGALARAGGRSRGRAKLVTLVHHLAASERTGLSRRARLAVEGTLLRASDRIIVTSRTTEREVVAAGVDPGLVRVVPPGRDRLGARSAPPPRAAVTRLLFIGSLIARKDVLTLLAAFERVAGAASLTIVGPADRDHRYAAEVLAAALRSRGSVRVTGALDDESLARELARHDVLVLPSRYEGYGIVLAEALSHGLAIIATRAGATPEVVRDGREARLVPPGDAVALGEALSRITSSPALLVAMQHMALARAAELPRWCDTQREFAAALGVESDARSPRSTARPKTAEVAR